MNVLDPSRDAQVRSLLIDGFSIRQVARAVGVSAVTVWGRQRALRQSPVLVCPCGLPMGHMGWCVTRVARSPGRQAYLERCRAQTAWIRRRVDAASVVLPYYRAADLMRDRFGVDFRGFWAAEGILREDALQELWVLLLEDPTRDRQQALKEAVWRARDPDRYRTRSLYGRIGRSDMRLLDVLRAP